MCTRLLCTFAVRASLFVLVIGSVQLSPPSMLLLGFFFSEDEQTTRRRRCRRWSLLSANDTRCVGGRKKRCANCAFFFFQSLSARKTRPSLLLSFKTEIWLFLYLIFSRVQLFVSSPQLRRRIVRSGWQWRATGVSQSFAIFVVDM